MKKNKGMSGGKMVAVGAGVAAVGAGAYYLLGPNKKAHQKKAKVLMSKIEQKVTSQIKKAKTVTAPIYHKAVEQVSAEYLRQYKAHEGEIKAYAKKLKSKWKTVAAEANKKIKKTIKAKARKKRS